MQTELDIIICTYNNQSLLNRALSCLQNQEHSECIKWSVIVIDNNSSDNTAKLVQDLVELFKPVRLKLVIENRQGLVYAKRRGIKESSANLLAFLDDDVFVASDWLCNSISFLESHPKAGAVGSRVILKWERNPDEILLEFSGNYAEQDLGLDILKLPVKDRDYLVGGGGLVIRRQALEDSKWLENGILVGRRGIGMASGEDVEMVLSIARAGYELWYNPKMQVEHFISERKMSLEYLCKLHRGNGKSWPQLYTIRRNQRPKLSWKLNIFFITALSLVATIWKIFRKAILAGRLPSDRQKIKLNGAIGRIEGSTSYLWHQ